MSRVKQSSSDGPCTQIPGFRTVSMVPVPKNQDSSVPGKATVPGRSAVPGKSSVHGRSAVPGKTAVLGKSRAPKGGGKEDETRVSISMMYNLE